jgi:peroxiredoxin
MALRRLIRNKTFSVIAGYVLVMMLACFLGGCDDSYQPKVQKAPSTGEAPDFSLKDLDGKTFKLSAYRGNPVLLIFSATWCPECRSEIPYFKHLHATYKHQGVEVVTIDVMEKWDKVKRFSERYDIPYKMLLDETGAVAEAYGVRGVPTIVLIDKAGKVVCYHCRSVDLTLNAMLANR